MAVELRRLVPGEHGSNRSRSEVAGLDALETQARPRTSTARRAWAAIWPKALAIGIVLVLWEAVVWTGWRPAYVLPPPSAVLARLGEEAGSIDLWAAIAVTLRRAVWGFGLAVAVGVAIGILVSRFAVMRSAIGSLIMGLQTMPSIAWFPLAILLFKLSEEAIMFVVVLGAAPSIANGLIHGVDHIPPVLTRAGRVLGARGLDAYRHVILPAAMPSFVAGLKQGWAFAWRSLMAGELLVVIANRSSLGQLLQVNRELSDSEGLLAVMMVILIIGILLDAVVFGTLERRIRAKRGLLVT